MAKVIFEFNRPEHIKYQGKDSPCINMNVRMDELSPAEETGPHDVLASIINSMAPEIIEKASRELLKSARKEGLNVKGKLFSYDPDAATH